MTTTKTAEDIIAHLGLKPHPEGGYFRETFRDEGAHKGRAHSTAILYLLRAGEVSRWHRVDALPETAFDNGAIVLAGRDRLRGKLSYSNIGFALAPETFTLAELRDVYEAALGYDVSATNLKRVLLRRGAIETVGKRRAHGPAGGRPAELYRFRARAFEVTDPFAVLRPPE